MLPGKLSIGFLQEDNPNKFFFRIRPLVAHGEQGYILFENAKQDYSEDGYIRIVPDKNEISNFKARMRSLGHYCLMDLRRHPSENDKIRPNKNYSGEIGDKNAYIIYSDVIERASALKVAEVLDYDVEPDGLEVERPHSTLVFLRRGDKLNGPYGWTPTGELRASLHRADGVEPMEIGAEAAEGKLFTVSIHDDRPVTLILDLGEFGIHMPEPVAEPAPAFGFARPFGYQPPTSAAQPAVSVQGAQPAPPPAAAVTSAPPAAADSAAQPDAPAVAESPAATDQPTAEPPAMQIEPVAEVEPKPWLHPTSFPTSRVINSRLNPREQSLQAQSGINPNRGRSIQDIIDEQWRQSRYDQLGHPIPPDATSTPVISPFDRAIEALKEVWALEDVRERMAEEIASITGIPMRHAESGGPDGEGQARYRQSLEQLEAERIKLTAEVDLLKQGRAETRDSLLMEVKKHNAQQLNRDENRLTQLTGEIRTNEEIAAKALHAAQTAGQTMRDMSDQLDQRIADQLAEGRARDLLISFAYGAGAPAAIPALQHPSGGQLVSDMRVRFEAAGISLSNDDTVNLLACLALSPVTVLSGAVGSGKSAFARLMGGALGLTGCGRFAEIQAHADWAHLGERIVGVSPNGIPVVRMPAAKQVLSLQDRLTPAILMIDEANNALIDCYAGELIALGEPGAPATLTTAAAPISLHPQLRVIMTVQDDGFPLTARLLDRAFMIRLPRPSLTAPVTDSSGGGAQASEAVSLDALLKIFQNGRELPGELTHRLQRLREQLAEYGVSISRRAIADVYRYVGATLHMMQCEPMEILDRALQQRALPAILASADLRALKALPGLLEGLPRCFDLLNQPLALPAL